jgi:sugar phosphate permease
MVPTYFISSMPTGVLAAAIQNMNPNTMRGTASAMLLLVTNLIGQALGPIAIAILTDKVFADPMKLPYSMVIVTVVCHLIAVPAFWLGRKSYVRSVERAAEYAAAT